MGEGKDNLEVVDRIIAALRIFLAEEAVRNTVVVVEVLKIN